jgi:hypothetical protein
MALPECLSSGNTTAYYGREQVKTYSITRSSCSYMQTSTDKHYSSVMTCDAPFCSEIVTLIVLPLGQRIVALSTVVPAGIPNVVLIGDEIE